MGYKLVGLDRYRLPGRRQLGEEKNKKKNQRQNRRENKINLGETTSMLLAMCASALALATRGEASWEPEMQA